MRALIGPRLRFGLGVVAIGLGWLCVPPIGRAAVPGSMSASTWVTNGPVSAVLVAGDRIYIGGQFSYIGPSTGSGAALDLRRGSVAAPSAKVDGSVLAVVSDGAGGYYLGGRFDRVGGVPRANLAHVEADGALDPAWNPSPDSSVLALALSGSTIYAGGYFHSIHGQSRRGIAALDARGGRVSAWHPDANGRGVFALAVSGPTVYAGGVVTKIGGRARRNIAALDARSGRASAWNPNANSRYSGVSTLAVRGSTVYAGGEFIKIGGRMRSNVAALDARTG